MMAASAVTLNLHEQTYLWHLLTNFNELESKIRDIIPCRKISKLKLTTESQMVAVAILNYAR